MYGVWYLVIGFGVLLVLGIVLLIINYNYLDNDCGVCFGFGTALTLIGAIGFLFCFISVFIIPLQSKQEYLEFQIQKEQVELVIESGNDYANLAISQTIIELNTWLAEAKANKQTYGCFSNYYYIDLDNIEPIVNR